MLYQLSYIGLQAHSTRTVPHPQTRDLENFLARRNVCTVMYRAFIIVLLALAACPAIQAETLAQPGEHTMTLNGVHLWYKVAGVARPGVAPLLYLAGGPGYNSYSFEKTIGTRLEKTLPIIYFDQRGTGRSERPTDADYSMATLTADVDALRRALGLPQISIVGHSFGGTLALEYARRYPRNVQKLILVDGAADYPAAINLWRSELETREPARWTEALKTPEGHALLAAEAQPQEDVCALTKARFAVVWQIYSEPGMAQFHHWQQFHDQKYELEQGAWDAQSKLGNTGEIQNAYLSVNNPALCYRFTDYTRLTMPVLVIEGRFDGSVDPAQARTLAEHLPHARYDEFGESAHFPYAEQPAKFALDVTAFLDPSLGRNRKSRPATGRLSRRRTAPMEAKPLKLSDPILKAIKSTVKTNVPHSQNIHSKQLRHYRTRRLS